MQDNADFYTQLWIKEWKDMEINNPTARHLKYIIFDFIKKIGPIKSLADIGCGCGVNIKKIAEKFPDLKITGFDLSKNILDLAKKYVNSNNVKYEVSDLSKTKKIETFDLVLCSQVLEHILDDKTAVKNLIKMTKKYLIITVPSGKFNSTSKLVGHHRHYSVTTIKKLFKSPELKIIYLKSWGFPFHSIYKFLLNLLPEKSKKNIGFGKYGFLKKTISNILYFFFFGNIFNRGDNIIFIAKKIK